MATEPLEMHDLLTSTGDILGFDIVARYPGAIFYGSGGYHSQLAGNVWNSRCAEAAGVPANCDERVLV